MNSHWLKKEIMPAVCPPLKKAFWGNVVLQVLILNLSALLLDGGFVAQFCWPPAVIWWCAALIISKRRPQSPTKIDMIFMHAGYIFLIVVFYLLYPFWGWLR